MKTGLYTGRFQPFHLGHLSAVKQALKQVNRLYIAIGSSQYDHEENNPFTAKERAEMIRLALVEASLQDKCEIFLVPDIHDDDQWVTHVRKMVPPFEMVFVGNNGLVKELFEKEGKAQVILVNHEIKLSATKIRQTILRESDWEKYVSQKVSAYLKKMGGLERIRGL